MMDFTIYTNASFNDWILAPFYDSELSYLYDRFKENKDFIIFQKWDHTSLQGYDIFIHNKVFNWMILQFGKPNKEEYILNDVYHAYQFLNKFLSQLPNTN